MQSDQLFLGLDTSNYTTSAALVDINENIVADSRKILEVKQGEKGLRQSDALFQHWKNLPVLLEPLLKEYCRFIAGVCAGSRPRPQEGSYMPVFTAGTGIGTVVAASLNAQYSEISHQEGHLLSAAHNNDVSEKEDIILTHLSGGTLEFVKVSNGIHEIVYATKDISYGQLIDRTGVFLGMPFPAGRYVDEMAVKAYVKGRKDPVSRVFMDDSGMNLSGLENSLKSALKNHDKESVCAFLMERISESFIKACDKVSAENNINKILVCGGVASSEFLRNYCKDRGYIFGEKALCSDNAAGEAIAACRNYKKDKAERVWR